ncbi:hypothetical protein F5Y10DRAFT_254830 [Nemania abortiva]|nr:hypothetical protein F5Y10DRAFT_254830 [Nemania abortiva]
MHHDVAAPMILDPAVPCPVVCANPLRTNFHRCELVLPPLTWVLNTPMLKCPFHTCCVPYVEVEYCSNLMSYLDREGEEEDFDPEECDEFILEHHHTRLPYFGDECAYREPVPATWRNLASIRGKRADWFPDYAHSRRHRAEWEQKHFEECERLYTLEEDALVISSSVEDLTDLSSWDMVQTARAQLMEAESKLHEQRKLVYNRFERASNPCGWCER